MDKTKNRYQVMPPLSDEEYQALKADIAERGVMLPIVVDGEENIIDGHHRVQAVEELESEGHEVPGVLTITRWDLETDQDKLDEAWRLNMQRRHLNHIQKQQAIAGKLKESPEWADNRIAKLLGVDHKTVRSVRLNLERHSEIPKVEKLIGADGKEYPRQQVKTTPVETEVPTDPDDYEAERAAFFRENYGFDPPDGSEKTKKFMRGVAQAATQPTESSEGPTVGEFLEANPEAAQELARDLQDNEHHFHLLKLARKVSAFHLGWRLANVSPEEVASVRYDERDTSNFSKRYGDEIEEDVEHVRTLIDWLTRYAGALEEMNRPGVRRVE